MSTAILGPASAAVTAPNPLRLADALARHRRAAAEPFMRSVVGWAKYAHRVANDPEEFVRRYMFAYVDYLGLYFRTGDPTYKDLYVGEKLKQLFDPKSSPGEEAARRVAVTDADTRGLVAALADKLIPEDLSLLRRELDDIARVVTTQGKHTCRVLMVGDCLYLDLVAFLTGPCLEDGITLQPTFVTSKNPAEVRRELRALAAADRKFDLVFYSPFTYEFSPDYARLHHVGQSLRGGRFVRRLVDPLLADAMATLDLIADLFECNVFVHNSANVRRHDGSLRERAKNLLTLRVRSAARRLVNRRIAEHVRARNAAGYDHLFVLDEAALLGEHGDGDLGLMYYNSELQHPAALGRWLAAEYRDVIAVHAQLLKRKLVVCDLDNTLWRGVIGEGAGVEHYRDRQQTLKRLQAKGVVLAVNSKNDPKNVRWDGGVLSEGDFVCAQINWDNKVLNMKRIAESLNLRTKDFVFVDDRVDEREMVKMALPEVHCLDATADRAWRMMDLWARVLPTQGETDRTQFYKQREQRQSFLDAQAEQEDQAKLFEKLGLHATIRRAAAADLKRVAELINRTNQFNLCGTRTSLREVTGWHESPDWRVLVVDAGDRFGPMGTVAVLVLHLTSDRVEIPAFVLSCRVFGYRIEHALLNHVKRLAHGAGGDTARPVVGLYEETPHNEPCRKVYPENGFEWDGKAWVCPRPGETQIMDPEWLTIHREPGA